jgi:hypothetical protein
MINIKLFICYLTIFFEFILRRTKFYAIFNNYSFIKINYNFGPLISEINTVKVINRKFQDISILSQSSINNIISAFYNSDDFKKILRNYGLIGMKADFFVCYTNFHFEDFDDKKKSHFAEKFHFDTCFSKNTLKLFIIINNVSTSDGPLQYYSKPDYLFREDICLSSSLEEFTGQEGAAIVGSAATNLHRASIPLVGKKRTQIMIQFNPYKKNAVNENLYKYQFKKEMKFPFIRTFLDKYYVL